MKIQNPTKCFKPILFALNDDSKSEEPMIEFLVNAGLEYLGKQNQSKYGFSRENVFICKNTEFKLIINWMRNISTIQYSPNGWDGAFTEVLFDNVRECGVGYADHYSLAFCLGEYEMMKLAIPNVSK